MFENIPKKLINTILTVVSAVVMMMWAWRYFGPGGREVRAQGSAQAAAIGLSFGDFVWIGVAVACGGCSLICFGENILKMSCRPTSRKIKKGKT